MLLLPKIEALQLLFSLGEKAWRAGRGGEESRLPLEWAACVWRGCGAFCTLDLGTESSPWELGQCCLLVIFFSSVPLIKRIASVRFVRQASVVFL